MDKYQAFISIPLALLSQTAFASADDNPTYIVTVTQDSEPEYVYADPTKHRIPRRPVVCTISPDGISIPSITTEDILSYEVYNSEGYCMASFTSEDDFISYVFNIKTDVEIRIHTDGYVFHGFIFIK